MKGSYPPCHLTFNYVASQEYVIASEKVISSLPKCLWSPNLAGWWHTRIMFFAQSDMILWLREKLKNHATNWKDITPPLQELQPTNLEGCWLYGEGSERKHISRQWLLIFFLYFHLNSVSGCSGKMFFVHYLTDFYSRYMWPVLK